MIRNNDDDLIPLNLAAIRVRKSRSTLLARIREGSLPAYRQGPVQHCRDGIDRRPIFIKESDLGTITALEPIEPALIA